MSTAHRPTWAPAKGSEEQGGNRLFFKTQYRSAKDTTAHTKMKMRQDGQSSLSEIRQRDLRAELEEKEHKHFSKKELSHFEGMQWMDGCIVL